MQSSSIIFGLEKGYRLAKEIASILDVKLGTANKTRFADSEVLLYSNTTVRGRKTFVCQSTCAPVNDTLMDLLIFIDSLKRASAKEINVVVPYFGYARQDRKSAGRYPITASLVAKLIQKAGASRVILLDSHSEQIQGFFDIPVDNLWGGAVLIKTINEFLLNQKEEIVVVSPDYGGVVRARTFANKLHTHIAIIDKQRILPNKSKSLHILGDVKDKIALVVDDIIDTGGTILKAINLLIEKGAKEVWVAATHPVFSNDAMSKLEASEAQCVFVANTIDIPNYKKYKKLHISTVAPFLADVIKAIEEAASITKVYESYTKI